MVSKCVPSNNQRVQLAMLRIGELNNTLIIVVSDNGASGEGGLGGTFNEIRVLNGIQTSAAENMPFIDEWVGPPPSIHSQRV